ncbi:MAG: hypothetical protein QOJ62_1969 [Actinomycetota bacterium]|jgi:uncharacterized membrane protein YccC|nr:hypothetical protein [Actinomycetota bacterium]
MLEMRAAPRRWPRALRASVCMGVPVLVGWLAGDLGAGLTATLGGFTALYGSGRPYLNRAALLAVVAVALSAAVGLGIWTASIPWLGVLIVAAIGTVATLLCNALEVGPPGAYQFALVCAVGIGLHSGHQDPIRSALLVLAGGCLSWVVHMAGAAFGPRGPEKSAVAAGGVAVADYIDAIATNAEDAARHHAAQAMHDAWKDLISYQPRRLPPSATVRRLRDLTRRLHMTFADAMSAASSGTTPDPSGAAAARALAGRAFDRTSPDADTTPIEKLPLGRPGARALIRVSVQPGSRALLVVIRVGVATIVAGGLAGLLGLEHAYWAMAAAVLVLHQGLDRRRMTQRALERLVGTWTGLLLAAAVIATHPHALWLVAVIMLLNFLVELTVVRNYTLAVVFITAVALVISTGAHGTDDLGALLLARGVDTAVGCAVALAVFLLLVPASVTTWLPAAIADTLDAVATTAGYLATATVTTPEAKAARRDLQRSVLRMAQTFDTTINGNAQQHRAAEHMWPAIAATQRLAYRTVAECWRLEQMPKESSTETADPTPEFVHVQSAVRATAEAMRAGRNPPAVTITEGTLSDEVRGVRDALAR